MKTKDRLIIWGGALVLLVLIGRLYFRWVTPYGFLGSSGGGPIVRLPDGSSATRWETRYRVDHISGVIEEQHTDLGRPQLSYSWRPKSSTTSSYVL